ncbi:hypothetical protein BDZ45DRAFT_195513 [Acephala macrosclerotiorum]|nr:hypothetical protein BDZ45DRAFT_195513 [Acephala macrosclerotiorum]
MSQSTRHPPTAPPTSDPQPVPKPEPFPAPTTLVDTAKVALLYNVTTQKLNYITVTELYTLSIRKRVAHTYVPIWTRRVNIHTGCKGLGSDRHLKLNLVWLPCYVVFWRVFGWWPIMWLVEGEEV